MLKVGCLLPPVHCLDQTKDCEIGRVVIHSLSTPESYAFDYKRPMRAVALEPDFAKKKSRAFVCGGMAGNLILQEKGWMGYKEQILHSGEGPIWAIEWRRNLIAWANDLVRPKNILIGFRLKRQSRE